MGKRKGSRNGKLKEWNGKRKGKMERVQEENDIKRKRNINGEKKIINERERKWKETGKWKGKYSKQRKLSEYGNGKERKVKGNGMEWIERKLF